MSPMVEAQGRGPLRRSLILVALLAAILVVGLAIITHAGGHAVVPQATPRLVGEPAPGPLSDATHAPAPAAASAARTFFSGYLPYRYGQGAAAQIRDASPQLIAGLAQARPSVIAATRALHPVVVRIGAREAGGRVLHLTALVSDGIARYPIGIVMVRAPHGWETTQLASPE